MKKYMLAIFGLCVFGIFILIWGNRYFSRENISIENIGQYTSDVDFRSSVDHEWKWVSQKEGVFTEGKRVFDEYLGENYQYAYDEYTYILTFGYTLDKLEISDMHVRGKVDGHTQYLGFVTLGTDCEATDVFLYRSSPLGIVPAKGVDERVYYEKVVNN